MPARTNALIRGGQTLKYGGKPMFLHDKHERLLPVTSVRFCDEIYLEELTVQLEQAPQQPVHRIERLFS